MTDDSEGSRVLDDEGRLFGLVNVIDLLVVLLVLAVVVAGAALLLSGSGEPDSRHATVDLGDQPDFIASEIEPGDEFDVEGSSDTVTITDVYRYDGDDGTSVLVRVTINGTTIEPDEPEDRPRFEFRGEQLRVGQQLPIQTPDYEVEGEIVQLQRSGEQLPVTESDFLVETTVSESTADELSTGDEYRVAGETLAEITDIQQFPAEDGDRTVLLGLSAQVLERDGGAHFGSIPVRVGSELSFVGDGYELSAEIVRRGTSTIDTEPSSFLIETTVGADIVDDIRVGDQYRLSDEPIVDVESKTVYTTDQADVRRVILGVSVAARTADDSIRFGDRELRIGESIPVQTGEYDIEGEIIRRGALEEAGEPATRTASVLVENIRPERADTINVGQTERLGDDVTAEVLEKSTEPAEIILESDDGNIFLREHPRNLDVTLEIELQVRELDGGSLRFRGDSLRTGDSITLELGQLRIEGEVASLGE